MLDALTRILLLSAANLAEPLLPLEIKQQFADSLWVALSVLALAVALMVWKDFLLHTRRK